jgi:glucose/arabinose dehydrogenase
VSHKYILTALVCAVGVGMGSVGAITLPQTASAAPSDGAFREAVVFSGLQNPTSVRFSPDGRVFVGEKSGLIKVFDSLTDPTPDVFADLRTNVYNFWDRGLLGLELHPNFSTTPYVYVLYTYDHILGDTTAAPRWGTAGATSDSCPTPPGPATDGCVVSGRLSRLQASGNTMVGAEDVLIEDWCQQFPSHSIGALEFGPDGALYASAGDGASFTFVEYGQAGIPTNPCGDPPVPVGGAQTPPTAEGGTLRSQDLRTRGANDPVGLDGTIIRIDPGTGAALPTNPLAGDPDPNARRIIAYGLRNPLRFALRPGTSEIWVGDVGWGEWEEINRIASPTDSVVENFGWPCYEGRGRQPSFDAADLAICEEFYGDPQAETDPYFTYQHSAKVVPGESCPTGGSSVSGLSFDFGAGSSPYPEEYASALFFADYSRKCIWVMKRGADGVPSPGHIETLVPAASGPVDLEIGPGGELFYVDFDSGTIRRVFWAPNPTSQCPDGQFLAEYFANRTLSGNPTFTRCEGAIDYDWGPGGPGNGLAADDFSVRWTGNFGFSAGENLFTTTSDDGIRLWVAGSLLIDHWVDQGATTYSASPTLTAGTHEVKVEYYEHVGDALARVTLPPPPPTGSCPTGQFFAEYFANRTLAGSPTFARCEGAIDYDWGGGGPANGVPTDDFSVRWTGNFDFAAGDHAFSTTSDDGIRLWVEGALLIDRWVDQGATTYTESRTLTAGTHPVRVEYYEHGGDALARVTFGANRPPVPTITTPGSGFRWRVGTTIAFAGSASDPEDGSLPAAALSWSVIMHHCPSNCHTHVVQDFTGTASGSFVAPDHEWPSHLELRLTARDSGGLTSSTSLMLDPETTTLSFASQPPGLQLAVNGVVAAAPFDQTVIIGSRNSVSAPSPQALGGTTYTFGSWSDGGAQTHDVVAPATPATYTATYTTSTALAITTTSVPGGTVGQPYSQTLAASGGATPYAWSIASGVLPAGLTLNATSGVISGTPTAAGTASFTARVADAGAPQQTDTQSLSIAIAVAAAPANTALPSISGQPRVGRTLIVSDGTWTGTGPITFSYQWLRCTTNQPSSCAAIEGAVSATYVPVSSDVGLRLRARVTATNGGGSTPAVSSPTAAIKT